VKREKVNYMILSVTHALDVLEELAKGPGEIGVTELSKSLKLHKNNVFRLLATLELRSYVEQNKDSENYRLGPKVAHLGQAYSSQNDVVTRAAPVLKSLAELSGETVSMAILRNGQVEYPISVESRKPVRVAARQAVSFPAKMNAAGRLLTAQLPDSVLAEVLAGNTPQDAAIKNQMNELRASGQIVDKGATEADVVSMSKLVRGVKGEILGAVELMAPQHRAKIDMLMQQLDEAAQALSAAMGSQGSMKKSGLMGSMEKEVVQTTHK
jgi:IclR family KDG regulon transcriptional repressor